MAFKMMPVLMRLGCCNKIPQTGAVNCRPFSGFWGLGSLRQGVSITGFW